MQSAVDVVKGSTRVHHKPASSKQKGVAGKDVGKGVMHGLAGCCSIGCKGITLGLVDGKEVLLVGVMSSRDVGFLNGAGHSGPSEGQPDEVNPGGRGGAGASDAQRGRHVVGEAPVHLLRRDAQVLGQLNCSELPSPFSSVGGAEVAAYARLKGGEGAHVVCNNGTPTEPSLTCLNSMGGFGKWAWCKAQAPAWRVGRHSTKERTK